MAAPDLPAIPAAHWPLAESLIYHGLVRPALRRQFGRVAARLVAPAPQPDGRPLIVMPTHTAWWDAYMLFVMSDHLLGSAYQNYIMMEERQLRAYRFFRWCGAFSVARGAAAAASLHYSGRVLREHHDRCLWIFPQGRIVPAGQRPLRLYPGLARIVQQLPQVWLWPIALHYEFRGTQHPEAFIRAGTPVLAGTDDERDWTHEATGLLTDAADALADDLRHERLSDYHTLMRGRSGIDQWWDRLRRRAD